MLVPGNFFDDSGYPHPEMDGMIPHDECGHLYRGFKKPLVFDPNSYMSKEDRINWDNLLKNLERNKKRHPSDFDTRFEFEQKRTPRVCEVSFEELDSDLMAGVKTKPFKSVDFTPSIYKVGRRELQSFDAAINDSIKDEDGNHIISVVSFVAESDLKKSEGAWSIFCLRGLSLLDLSLSKFGSEQKYLKVTQTYKLAVEDRSIIPYLQLACNVKRAKYLDQWYEEGQVITLFVSYHFMPKLPTPALISVQPKADVTFVPMMPKQKLQVITNTSKSKLEFTFDHDSSLNHNSFEVVTDQRAKSFGGNVRCDFFECVKTSKTQESIFVNSRGKCQIVTIPTIQETTNKRYAVIKFNYVIIQNCIVYSHNIDGFIMKSSKIFNLIIDKNCPLSLVYVLQKTMADSATFCEIKVKLTESRPYFRLEKISDSENWIAKTD